MGKHQFLRSPGPLGPYAADYERYLTGLGYTFGSLQHRMVQFNQLSRWLESEGMEASGLNETDARRFVAWRAQRGRVRWTSPWSLRLPLNFLYSIGVIEKSRREGPFEDLVEGYRRYLSDERGLVNKTVEAHVVCARRFCAMVAANGPAELVGLRSAQLNAYLLDVSRDHSADWVQKEAGSLRSFLRYLHVAGATSTSLVDAVPKVARHRRGPQPQGLDRRQIGRLLASCDRRRGVGRRDYAILMMLARLGLRAGEVAAMTVDDFDWRAGEVLVRGKGGRHERLPLPDDVGQAVAAYLQRGRPKPQTATRAVFLRARAPWTPLGLPGVQTVVRYSSVRAGLGLFGPRRLRQSAATMIQRNGLPLTAVAQVLRHHDIRITTVYVDVDPAAVATLARPWPAAGGEQR